MPDNLDAAVWGSSETKTQELAQSLAQQLVPEDSLGRARGLRRLEEIKGQGNPIQVAHDVSCTHINEERIAVSNDYCCKWDGRPDDVSARLLLTLQAHRSSKAASGVNKRPTSPIWSSPGTLKSLA